MLKLRLSAPPLHPQEDSFLKQCVLDENEVDCSRLGMSPYCYLLLLSLLLFSI